MKLVKGRITIDSNVQGGKPCIRDTGVTVAELFKAQISRGVISTVSGVGPSFDHTDIREATEFIYNCLDQNWASWAASAAGVRHAKLPKGFELVEE